jgi:hypothetical protein
MKRYKLTIDKKIPRFVIIILAILIEAMVVAISWYAISECWQSKYDSDNYNCLDMSIDCGHFFKSIGVPVKLVYGHHYDNANETNMTAHCWLQLFGCIEFESTALTIHLFNDNANYYHVDIKQDI